MIYIDRIEVVNKLAPYAGISHPGSCDCLHSSWGSSGLVCRTSLFHASRISLSVSISCYPYSSWSCSLDPRCFQLSSEKIAEPEPM